MNAAERRNRIIQKLEESDKALSGSALAKELGVSRQIIVQDVGLLRAKGTNIISTNLGYVLPDQTKEEKRVFKLRHTDEEVSDELSLIVDCGGIVKDVFIYHKVYGTVRADMNIRSREDVRKFLEKIASGSSSLLKNVTSGYHYHTVLAPSEETLDLIQERLSEKGFLAPLQEYEPVDLKQTN
ncbi:MAG: transcription repressor NadR [Eubacterium sp.]|nr:transcription repressor NadR [Eubacterium sp.]